MTERTDDPSPAANENINPFLRADTALAELHRLRREVLSLETRRHSFERWRERREVLKKLDKAIGLCLRKL